MCFPPANSIQYYSDCSYRTTVHLAVVHHPLARLFTPETGLAAGKSGLRGWRADRASWLLFGDKTHTGKTILCLCFFPAIIRFPQVGWLHPALHPVVRSSCTLNSSLLHFYFALHVINLVITHTESSVVYYYAASLLKPRNKEVVSRHRIEAYQVRLVLNSIKTQSSGLDTLFSR